MSLFIHKQPNIISNNILPPPPPPSNMSNLSAIGMGSGQLPPTLGGGGGVECDQISDIRPPKKSNIRYQTPKKSNIRLSRVHKNQISGLKKLDVGPQKKIKYQISHPLKKSNIGYQGTPVPPPSPPPPPPPTQ